jgi:D-3-phosphoglycerate dehydrogenase / 2-oxoglutarate reductase
LSSREPPVSASEAVVLVTARSFGGSRPELRERLEAAVHGVRWNELGRPLQPDELRTALEGVDGAIAGVDHFDAGVIDSAQRLRVIARHGTGVDGIDLAAARRRGIVVTNTPGANAEAVAELAIGLMFALARRIVAADRRMRAGAYGPLPGAQLAGSTVGVIGLGHVGAAVARRATALGCRVVGFDPAVEADQVGATAASLESVVAQADFLTLHVPVTAGTRDMVDAELLGRMKPGSHLVNTARGELIVEADLLAALEAGRLGGAALDALRDEPPDPGHPLLAREDVIVTPHMGADTEEARAAMGRMALDDLLAVLDGRRPKHPVEEGSGG